MSDASIPGLDLLRRAVRGEVLTPDQPGYDAARRTWNAAIDSYPAAILRCGGAEDARVGVDFARNRGLPVSIRAGGHSIAGHSVGEGSMMIDLSLMRGVRIDADARRLTVEAGATWKDVLVAGHRYNLATPGGFNPEVGVAGLTLGGGYGALTRLHGLACDNLIGVQLVDAQARTHSLDATDRTDLFWAMRGAGANFGLVTGLTFKMHEVPSLLAGRVYYPLGACRTVLRGYRDLLPDLPDAVTAYLAIRNSPGDPGCVFIGAACFGPADAGAAMLAPFARLGTPLAAELRACSYLDLHATTGEGFPHGYGNAWKALFVRGLDDATLDTIAVHAAQTQDQDFYIVLEHLGGAMARLAPDATAFPHRDAAFGIAVAVKWKDPGRGEVVKAQACALHAALRPAASGVYVNYVGAHPEESEIRAAYGVNLERLRVLKSRIDPDNVFRCNVNIPPLPPPAHG